MNLEKLLGIISIITGSTYVIGVYGPTEAEVSTWGFLAALMGGVLILLTLNGHKIFRVGKGILIFFLLLIQLPPIILWFLFHGTGISDGTPASSFVANYFYAIPHISIVLIGLIVIVRPFIKNRS